MRSRLLDEQVFDQLNVLLIEGSIDGVESGTFVPLRRLRFINLKISNVRRLFGRGLTWLYDLNSHLNVNTSNQTDIRIHINHSVIVKTFSRLSIADLAPNLIWLDVYAYPDEDFCWYVHFPFHHLLFVDIQTNCTDKCSCTQYWLLRHVQLLRESDALKYFTWSDLPIDFTQDFNKQLHDCQINDRVVNCGPFSQTRNDIQSSPNILDQMYYSQIFDFLMVILIPLVSVLGLATNLVNIIVIVGIKLDMSTEDGKQLTLLRFMLAYSVINCAYCFIHSFYLISKCTSDSGIYCSSVYQSYFAQFYKMIVVEFIGNSLRSLSNCVYLGISINRYILLENDSRMAKFFLNDVSKWKYRTKLLFGLLVVSFILALNTNKLFIFKAIDYKNFFPTFNQPGQDYFLTFPLFVANSHAYAYNYETPDSIATKSKVFLAFVWVNFCLNEVLLFVIFSVCDILLVVSLKRSLNAKKSIVSKLILSITNVNDQIKDIEQTELNIVRAILVNTFVLLAFKLFELAMTVSKFTVWQKSLVMLNSLSSSDSFCYTVKICLVYEELVKLFNLIAYSYVTALYYNLNKNFRNNFCALFRRSTSS